MNSSRPESAHCMSSKTRITGLAAAMRSKNSRQPLNRSARSASGRSSRRSRWARRGSTRRRSRSSGTCCVDRGTQLLARDRRRIVLADARAHADHLGQRPVRDALAVGQAAALVPPADVLDAVDVLEVLPQQARLARARVPDDGDVPRAALGDALLPGVDDGLELGVAADERGLHAGAATGSARAGDHAQRQVGVDGLLAALDLVRPGVLVRDRRFAGASRRVVDEHGAGRGDRLQPAGGVDGVAQDHALALGPELDRGRSGQHARAQAQLGYARPPRRARVTAWVSESAARTARSASSSRATGVPQTAMTASPMNFSTVPP